MAYTFRFYRFASLSAFLAEWAEAGLPVGGDGAPLLPGGALDVVGAVPPPDGTEGAPPPPGFHVNAAWPDAAPGALAAREVAPFEGLRAFAGWSTPAPPPPVPEQVTNWQARAAMRATIGPDGRSLERAVTEALAGARQAAAALPDADPRRIAADTAWLAWEQANHFTRHGDLVGQMAAQLGFGDAELDGLFRAAAALEA